MASSCLSRLYKITNYGCSSSRPPLFACVSVYSYGSNISIFYKATSSDLVMYQHACRHASHRKNKVCIQDIDEWLWKDAQMLENACRHQLITQIYASISSDTDNLNGIVVSIQVIQNNKLWLLFEQATSVCVCVCLFVWIKYIYFLQSHV